MFTGIITHTTKIVSTRKQKESKLIAFARPWGVDIKRGDSVNVNGVCSTARAVSARQFEVEYMPETLAKTTVGEWEIGVIVNIELSLRASDRLSGHIVQGHTDFVSEVLEASSPSVSPSGRGSWCVVRFALPTVYKKFIVEKGSVAINGVSLTVSAIGARAEVRGSRSAKEHSHILKNVRMLGRGWFEVSLIEYTRSHTNLNNLKKGDRVNVETDVIGKYIVPLVSSRT